MATFPTVDAVLSCAHSQIGGTEHPAGSNRTAYGAWYGMDGDAWCGMFVAWVFAHADGGIDLRSARIHDPQFTPAFYAEAKAAGWPVIADGSIRPGDVVLFDFIAPFNTAGIQHVGIATAHPDGNSLATIEGNTSTGVAGSQDNGGIVAPRVRSLDYIVAAIRPPYGVPGAHLDTIDGPLRLGSTGGSVVVAQRHLHVTADGVFGPHTDAAVRAFQSAHHLTVDGIIGQATASALDCHYL